MTSVQLRTRRLLGGAFVSNENVVLVAASAVALAVVLGFFWLAATVGPDLWVPLVVLLVLVAVSVPMCLLASGRPLDRRLRKILLVAFALKMACIGPRYLMNMYAYDGQSDAGVYHLAGETFRQNMSEGAWSLEGADLNHFPSETRFAGYVVGVIYLATGASQMVAYLVFAWMGWVGLMCVFRAFQIGFPNAPPYRMAYLLLFLPSLLYWPASVGKDGLMLFGIGLVVLGVARLLMADKSLLGLLCFAAGSVLMVQIRPHLLLIALVGVATSLIARNADGAPRGAAITRALLLAALVPLLMFGLTRMDSMFGASATNPGGFSVSGALNKASGQTATGGSAFEAQPVRSPADLPLATVNVIYRPFIFEVRNVPTLISALESTLLLALTVAGAKYLWSMGRAVFAHPLAAFSAGYTLAFVFAFSNIGNAGILARQRVQLFPVLMLLVAATAELHRLNSEVAAADSDVSPAPVAPSSHPDPRLVPVP